MPDHLCDHRQRCRRSPTIRRSRAREKLSERTVLPCCRSAAVTVLVCRIPPRRVPDHPHRARKNVRGPHVRVVLERRICGSVSWSGPASVYADWRSPEELLSLDVTPNICSSRRCNTQSMPERAVRGRLRTNRMAAAVKVEAAHVALLVLRFRLVHNRIEDQPGLARCSQVVKLGSMLSQMVVRLCRWSRRSTRPMRECRKMSPA